MVPIEEVSNLVNIKVNKVMTMTYTNIFILNSFFLSKIKLNNLDRIKLLTTLLKHFSYILNSKLFVKYFYCTNGFVKAGSYFYTFYSY